MVVRPAGRRMFFSLLVLLMSGCVSSDTETRSIRELLAKRSQALNSRNLDTYLSVVSQNYSSSGKNFVRLRQDVSSAFSRYDQLSYQPDTMDIEVRGATATVSGRYALKVVSAGRETVLNGEERLSLAKEQDGWKIKAGL